MPVVITCPACQRRARVSRKAIGKTIKCPSCGIMFLASRDDGPPPPPAELEPEEAPGPTPESPPEDDARRVERFGIGLLTLSQASLAASMALQLLAGLLGLVIADVGAKSPFLESSTEVLALLAVLGALAASVA